MVIMVTAAPSRKAAPAMARPIRSPGTIGPLPATKAPSRATPITPPTWRAALIAPEASPARSTGAASTTAVVAAGEGHPGPSGNQRSDQQQVRCMRPGHDQSEQSGTAGDQPDKHRRPGTA